MWNLKLKLPHDIFILFVQLPSIPVEQSSQVDLLIQQCEMWNLKLKLPHLKDILALFVQLPSIPVEQSLQVDLQIIQ